MEKIILNQIGMIIGGIIGLLWLEPIQILGVFLIMNLGFWCGYISGLETDK